MKFFYIYVLHNPLKNFIYIGYSEDLKNRIISHNKGENKSTNAYLPLELIHYEAYKNIKDAKRREEYLKTNRGRTTLITMLKEYFTQQGMQSYQKKSKRNYHKSNYVKTIPDWDNIKKLVWKRDESTCKSCGKKPSGQVHHIVARGDGGSNELTNLITLCGKCHVLVSPVPNHIISKVWHIPIGEIDSERAKVEERLKSLKKLKKISRVGKS